MIARENRAARLLGSFLFIAHAVSSVQIVCSDGSAPSCRDGSAPTLRDDLLAQGDSASRCPKNCDVSHHACDPTTAPQCTYPDPRIQDLKAACACRPGYKARGAANDDTHRHWRLPVEGQEHRVWVAEGVKCDVLCGGYGAQSCKEVAMLSSNCLSGGVRSIDSPFETYRQNASAAEEALPSMAGISHAQGAYSKRQYSGESVTTAGRKESSTQPYDEGPDQEEDQSNTSRPVAPSREQLPEALLHISGAYDGNPMIDVPPPDNEGQLEGRSAPRVRRDATQYQDPIPTLGGEVLSAIVRHPQSDILTPLAENIMPDIPPFDLPVIEEESIEDWVPPQDDNIPLMTDMDATATANSSLRNATYLALVRRQIMSRWNSSRTAPDDIGFRDKYGYVIEAGNGEPASLGEATYFTAVAATAVALGNYRPDAWESENANEVLEELLDVLWHRSWNNTDDGGVAHPVRHPDWLEYDAAGNLLRRRPLNRDSFGQIMTAGYYAFHCPNSSDAVRERAKGLISRWLDYLPSRGYRTHSNYIKAFDEFATEGKEFKNLFSDRKQGKITKLGKDTFQLMPHELVALRRCANSMGLKGSVVLPLFAISWETLKEFSGAAAHAIAREATNGLSALLEAFKGQASGWAHLVPGWDQSKVRVKLSLAIPQQIKDAMLKSFEDKVRDYVNLALNNPQATFLGQDEFVSELVSKIAALAPDALKILPLHDIFQSALKNVLPGSGDLYMLEDAVSLIAALQFSRLKPKDSSMAGFLFWNFAVAFDAQPALLNLVGDEVRAYTTLIRLNGNPNGMWAWMSGYEDIVARQLVTFEQNEAGWVQYAYASTAYDEWVASKRVEDAGTMGHFSPRIDYLALLAFEETGQPSPPGLDTSLLRAAVADAIDALVAAVRDAADTAGQFVETLKDAAGNAVFKTISASGRVMYETFDAVEQTARFVMDVDGKLEQTLWRAEAGVHYIHAKFVRALGGSAAAELVELHSAAVNAVRIWKMQGQVLAEFQKWQLEVVGGALKFGKMLAKQLRDPSGRLEQWVWAIGDGALLSFTVWRKSTELGAALWEDCVEVLVRDPAGVVRKWVYEVGKGLSGFFKWTKSKLDGFADASDMVQKVTRFPSGALEIVLFGPAGAVLDFRKWSSSSDVGGAVVAAAKEIEAIWRRDPVTSTLQEWVFEGGIIKKYNKWAKSQRNGGTSPEEQIVRIIVLPTGFDINWFKDGKNVGSKVLDKAGKIVKDGFKSVAGVIKGLKGVLGG